MVQLFDTYSASYSLLWLGISESIAIAWIYGTYLHVILAFCKKLNIYTYTYCASIFHSLIRSMSLFAIVFSIRMFNLQLDVFLLLLIIAHHLNLQIVEATFVQSIRTQTAMLVFIG